MTVGETIAIVVAVLAVIFVVGSGIMWLLGKIDLSK